jgi:HTH-type transcriptional repressor of NAD biosynthesis genes
MFQHGLVLGKFYPFHNGHKYLIDSALAQAETVTVLVCSLPTEKYPGEERAKWIRETYADNPKVKVVHCGEDLPQEPKDHVYFWRIWVDVVRRYVGEPDVIFTSESYGDPFATELGIVHRCIDKPRSTVPVSGTICRDDIYGKWDYLPPATQKYFRKKIFIMGPESTGKTTLTKELAKALKGKYLEEYGREYCEKLGDTAKLTPESFIDIAKEQIHREWRIWHYLYAPFFVCDTNVPTTVIFYALYAEKNGWAYDPAIWSRLTELCEQEDFDANRDIVLLLAPDIPWTQDGQRDFPEERVRVFNVMKQGLRALNYHIITGEGHQRLANALAAVRNSV